MTDEPRMTADDAYQALVGMDEFTTEQAVSALRDREEEIADRATLGSRPPWVVVDETVNAIDPTAGMRPAHLVDETFDGAARGRGRPPRPRRKPESEIVSEGIGHIRAMRDGYARKVHGGSMGNAGEPDVDACVRGRSCKFEAKAGSNTPSRVQLASLECWAHAGALVGWFRSTAELQQLLDHVDEPQYETDLSAPGCSQPCHREAA